ncbi:hypothetical protein D9V62_00395 [Buchnera aphidicola (Aphis helianthi)]|uniref:Flagellar hook-length control protein-like C-terminal domain-containing protein n=1 Tax=Buchnera aphidicola (Aphis helianthi) TaxID=2315802 RepID=A0A4D6XPB2_9GAMM|nr:flagellar hook-length control protein FliK [Buchnera aphidicola]QCI16914.1 hypothetical protein D9V62_00395 [Buchnera aphidicola (Aphis helianthi)]
MLNPLNNIVLKRNISVSSDYNIADFNLYRFIFNACKKKLLNKEIKFDNISTKHKTKDDENIISTNFIVNNLLNILNTKNVKNNFYMHKNTEKKQKKKLHENIKLTSHIFLKNKEKINKEENNTKDKIFKNNEMLKNLKYIKNKYRLSCNYNTINLFKKSYNESIFNKISNLKNIQNKKNFIRDNKNFMYFKNYKNNISEISSSKNMKNNQYSISEINSLKKINEKNSFKLNKKSIFVLNSKENIKWKQAINQQVLLSISNKENKAEIRLKPEYLGSIYIKIKMENDKAKLKLISDNLGIKNFLNNCIPFLEYSLIKNGIFLKDVNISSTFNLEKNKNLFISDNCHLSKSNIFKKFYKNLNQKQLIDMYV